MEHVLVGSHVGRSTAQSRKEGGSATSFREMQSVMMSYWGLEKDGPFWDQTPKSGTFSLKHKNDCFHIKIFP